MVYLFMIKQKMNANGKTLIGRKSIMEWKMKTPISFNQLLLYYSLIGNFVASRILLACDYIEKFDFLVSNLAETNPIEFLKKFLGEEEYNIYDFCEFLGWYLSEGYTRGNRVFICQSKHNKGNYKEIVNIVKNLGLSPTKGNRKISF